ncbi:hypothetical protein F5B20DRAFT_574650 [Whalleya microplaca]|nr:hypothetical protein F5B20DRAFT_574650 [Whalleya microplaca]
MAIVFIRRPEGPDVSQIPTPPHQAAAVFIIFFFTILALVAFSLRVWTRLKITRQWGLDDTLLVPAELCALLMCGPFYMYCKLGYFGWREEDVPEHDPAPASWWYYLAQIFYNPILAFVKCSVLVFILRIGGQKNGVRWAIYGLLMFTTGHAIGVFFGVLLQCLPVQANWDAAVKAHATCIDNSFHVAISSLTILTDILVLALPFYVFLGLNMRKTTKLAVICLFLSGGIVTAISIARVVALVQLFYSPSTLGDPYYDIKMTLSVVEVNLAITAACAPALRPLVKSWFPTLFGGSSNEYKVSGYGSSQISHRKKNLSHSDDTTNLALKNLHFRHGPPGHTEIRSISPNSSEEAISMLPSTLSLPSVHF